MTEKYGATVTFGWATETLLLEYSISNLKLNQRHSFSLHPPQAQTTRLYSLPPEHLIWFNLASIWRHICVKRT